MSNERTLITGASSGIGLALAREFARHGHPLIITAPVEAELKGIAEDLRAEHQVDVQYIAADLEQPDACDRIHSFARQSGGVDILVNNAGLGQQGKFWEIDFRRDLSMINVNITAVVHLTKLFLPGMISRGKGRILVTASIAGFEPGPLLTVYHASKAFVLSFCESLVVELEGTGVTLTALCPGATDTDFFPKADMEQTRIFQKGDVAAPREVAEKGYDAFMRGDPLYIPGAMNKALVFSRRFLTKKSQAKKNKKFYEEVPEHRRDRGDVELADERQN